MSDPQGFPGRFSYDETGGTQRDRHAVTLPEEQLSLRTLSAVRWQVAGLNKTGALVSLTIAADGTKIAGGEAWNTEDAPARRVDITHPSTGVYVITAQDSSYTDWRGDDGPPMAVLFKGGQVTTHAGARASADLEILSATSAKVRTFNAAGSAADMSFTLDLK